LHHAGKFTAIRLPLFPRQKMQNCFSIYLLNGAGLYDYLHHIKMRDMDAGWNTIMNVKTACGRDIYRW